MAPSTSDNYLIETRGLHYKETVLAIRENKSEKPRDLSIYEEKLGVPSQPLITNLSLTECLPLGLIQTNTFLVSSLTFSTKVIDLFHTVNLSVGQNSEARSTRALSVRRLQ